MNTFFCSLGSFACDRKLGRMQASEARLSMVFLRKVCPWNVKSLSYKYPQASVAHGVPTPHPAGPMWDFLPAVLQTEPASYNWKGWDKKWILARKPQMSEDPKVALSCL